MGRNGFLRKIKEKRGSVSIEASIITMIIFPLALGLLITGYLFFLASSENVNINFDTGRYISMNGCTITAADTLTTQPEWNSYDIVVITEKNTSEGLKEIDKGYVKKDDSSFGVVEIHCPEGIKKGEEFYVYSNRKVIKNFGSWLFPNKVERIGYYVKESN